LNIIQLALTKRSNYQSISEQLYAIKGILTDLLYSRKTTEQILSETRVQIEQSIIKEDADSPYVRIAKSIYALTVCRPSLEASGKPSDSQTGGREIVEKGIFTAFGMFWSREAIEWSRNPELLGTKLKEKNKLSVNHVDFSQQCAYIFFTIGARSYTLDKLQASANAFMHMQLRGYRQGGINSRGLALSLYPL